MHAPHKTRLLMVFMLAAAILSKSCHASDATTFTAPENTTNVNADQSNSNATESPSPTNQSNDAENADDEDDYVDLADMTDQELEEICTSRGFELVRETDATTGESLVYTHQDYVDAASECLQIEADLEEILQKHPEILQDVKQENERMMKERDRLQEQLEQMQRQPDQTESPGATSNGEGANKNENEDSQRNNYEEDTYTEETLTSESSNGSATTSTSENSNATENESVSTTATPNTTTAATSRDKKPIYDLKEIISEVNQQIKADIAKVINFIAPEPLRKQIQPALKASVTVAKDMGTSMYDLVKRHLMVFLNKNSIVKGDPAASGSTMDKETGDLESMTNNENFGRDNGEASRIS